jgi:hypothetical protein
VLAELLEATELAKYDTLLPLKEMVPRGWAIILDGDNN